MELTGYFFTSVPQGHHTGTGNYSDEKDIDLFLIIVTNLRSLVAAGSDQDDHGREPYRFLRWCHGSDLGSWRSVWL